MSDWQPIETAPKDIHIILFRPNAPKWQQVAEGKWDGQEHHKFPRPYWSCPWRISYIEGDRKNPPTHWMPLPKPPQDDK